MVWHGLNPNIDG